MRSAFRPLSVLCIVLLLAASSSCGGTGGAVAWPDTPAGRWLRDFVAAMNHEDDDARRQFIHEHYSGQYLAEKSIDDVLASMIGGKQNVGRIEVHSVTPSGDYGATMIALYSNYGVFFELALELDPEPPHDVIKMLEAPTASPIPESPLEIGDWATLPELLTQVREASGAPALAVAVVRGDRIIERAIVGSRRIDVDEPAEIGDPFHIGSITKSFTATLIATLVEQGELGWDVTIGEVLADLPVRDEYKPVTLEQLLQHRGGVPATSTRGEFAGDARDFPVRPPREGRLALTRQVLQDDPVIDPGTAMYYSNAGYVVAATMVERITGTSWEMMMRSRVFQPLELESAGFGWPATVDAPHQPWGHIGAPPHLKPHEPGTFFNVDYATYFAPAGDVKCSVTDLARYALAHLRGLRGEDGVLTSASIVRLHTAPEIDDDGGGYALGWGITQTEDGSPEHWHSGSAGSFFGVVSIYPDDDLAIAALTNYGLPAEAPLYQLMNEIRQHQLKAGP